MKDVLWMFGDGWWMKKSMKHNIMSLNKLGGSGVMLPGGDFLKSNPFYGDF